MPPREGLILPEVHCWRCKRVVQVVKPKMPTITASGRVSLRGQCGVCDAPVAGLTVPTDMSTVEVRSIDTTTAALLVAALRQGFEAGEQTADAKRDAAVLNLQRTEKGFTHARLGKVFGVNRHRIARMLAQARRREEEKGGASR